MHVHRRVVEIFVCGRGIGSDCFCGRELGWVDMDGGGGGVGVGFEREMGFLILKKKKRRKNEGIGEREGT